MNDIPAEFVANLMEGHTLVVPIDDHVSLEISLNDIRVLHGPDQNEPLDTEVATTLLFGLVTRDLILRDKTRQMVELVAEDPKSGITSLVEAYETGGDVVAVWHILVEALGRANVAELMSETLGQARAHAIHRRIKGEDGA
ncbi:hypothetical protein AB0K16_22225 [Nonomuraea jabiensis]|uniref:hypothetical protein n=1 Tax=Nonomuraea jabiensis TaxID=882448 RepID=UPI00344A90B0